MKRFSILVLIFVSSFWVFTQGNAAQCKPQALNEIHYSQGAYPDMKYCTTQTFSAGGCMPTVYAMVVANLVDSSVTPVEIRDHICNNTDLRTQIRGSGGNGPGVASSAFEQSGLSLEMANQYQVSFEKLNQSDISLDNLKSILKDGSMVVVSMKCPSPGSSNETTGCRFSTSSSGHYILLSNVDSNNQIVVLNPGRSDDLAQKAWSDGEIQENVIDVVSQGMWKATGTATSCNTNSFSGGSMTDTHANIFPNIKGNNCPNGNEATIFVDCNGEYTSLKEFLDDIFLLIKIAAPILVIVLSTIDYVKAIASSNADDLKKTNKRTIMRLVIGLLIFLLPYILELLFQLFGLYDINTAGIGK